MKRINLAIHGAKALEGVPQVRLVLNAAGAPELLHSPDGGGRFARVLRGYVGSDQLPKPVAIKLERDDIDAAHGAVKFISEYQAQVRIHQNLKDGDRTRVVRLFEIWKLPADRACDELPPTILCPQSRQTLAPRCPGCGEELRDDKSCPRACPTQSDDQILRASACSKCPAGTCPAYWLNRRTCKILLLELLDLDLEQYLKWRWSRPQTPPSHRPAWAKFNDEHMAAINERDRRTNWADDPLMAEFEEWRLLLGLFADAVVGVHELHARSIAHLDLKPANLCLTLEGASARLKVIDLGQADQPALPWGLRYQSICDDFEANRASGAVFWAPEQLPSRFMPADVLSVQSGNSLKLTLAASAAARYDILPGDIFSLPPTGQANPFLRVVRVATTPGGREITAEGAGDAAPTPPAPSRSPASQAPESQPPASQRLNGGCFVQQAGRCADVFALGLLLLYLIGRGRIDLVRLRHGINSVAATLRKVMAAMGPLPARAAVNCLLDIPDTQVAVIIHRLVDALPQGPSREPLKELLGIAFRACIRGVPGFSYAADRSDETSGPIEKLQADLLTIRNRLAILAQTHSLHFGTVAQRRKNGIDQLREWLRRQDSGPARGAPPAYDRDRISNALDLLSIEVARNEQEFRLLLLAYGGVTRWLQQDIDLFARELKARLTVARMHPVVVEMFRIISPSQKMTARRMETDDRDREGIKARKRLKAAGQSAPTRLASIRSILSAVKRGRRFVLSQQEITQLTAEIEDLNRAVGHLKQDTATLRGWHHAFQATQRSKIAGWDRLDLGGAGSWLSFGRGVLRHLKREEEAVALWTSRVERAAAAAAAVADAVRDDLVAPWPQVRDRHGSGVLGLGRRLWAAMLRRPRRVPVPVPDGRIAALTAGFDAALESFAEIGDSPLDQLVETRSSTGATPRSRPSPPADRAVEPANVSLAAKET